MKNILIFGGSSDIGISLANYLKHIGNNVMVTYYKHKVSDIESMKCDIRNEIEIENTFKYFLDKYKKIDIIINMAAISLDNQLLDITKEDMMDVLEVNLVGSFLTSKIYSKYIADGMIVNISSTDGIDTYNEYNMPYSISKAAMLFMSKNISMCTSNKVICICPNWIDSDSTRNIDEYYLDNELKRINQSRLITKDELNESIYKIVKAATSVLEQTPPDPYPAGLSPVSLLRGSCFCG